MATILVVDDDPDICALLEFKLGGGGHDKLYRARLDERNRLLSTAVGALLVGWILVELLFLREISFFHPLYVAIGLAFMWAGRRLGREQVKRL